MTIPNDIIEKMISKFEVGYNCTQLENEYSYNRRFFIIYMMMLQFT